MTNSQEQSRQAQPRKKTYRQGLFRPKNPNKYIGNVNQIVYRSSWELRLHQFFDNNPNVLNWSSESIPIPYIKPTDGKVHRYFPDYWVKYRNTKGEVIQEIIEVKPSHQVDISKRKRLTMNEKITYKINLNKWKAASDFCKKNDMTFRILTENQLFRQGGYNAKRKANRKSR